LASLYITGGKTDFTRLLRRFLVGNRPSDTRPVRDHLRYLLDTHWLDNQSSSGHYYVKSALTQDRFSGLNSKDFQKMFGLLLFLTAGKDGILNVF